MTPSAKLTIGTASRGRLRTVANVNATSSEHTLSPQSETGTLATYSGKMHDMEERQSFEKAGNIEASILQKIRIRSSTESSVRWGSEQDSLQNKKDSG